ncbi:hypothetical protein, partial [Epilithonimonas sp.]|uniref:hypothetical protein n=1 Tax=Epilithonimonas sp. TaxID=2894511 RepID=UPI002899086A
TINAVRMKYFEIFRNFITNEIFPLGRILVTEGTAIPLLFFLPESNISNGMNKIKSSKNHGL